MGKYRKRCAELKKSWLAMILAVGMLLVGCRTDTTVETEKQFCAEDMNQSLLDAAGKLDRSSELYFDGGLEVTGLGVTYDGRPTDFDGCYYFPAIEAMTGVHVSIDWLESEGYSISFCNPFVRQPLSGTLS